MLECLYIELNALLVEHHKIRAALIRSLKSSIMNCSDGKIISIMSSILASHSFNKFFCENTAIIAEHVTYWKYGFLKSIHHLYIIKPILQRRWSTMNWYGTQKSSNTPIIDAALYHWKFFVLTVETMTWWVPFKIWTHPCYSC